MGSNLKGINRIEMKLIILKIDPTETTFITFQENVVKFETYLNCLGFFYVNEKSPRLIVNYNHSTCK